MMSRRLVQSGPVLIVKAEMNRTCELKLIKPFNFQSLLSGVHDVYVKGKEKCRRIPTSNQIFSYGLE